MRVSGNPLPAGGNSLPVAQTSARRGRWIEAWHGLCSPIGMTVPDFLDRQLGIHADALKLRAQRLDLLASNIANAATPGFKARDLDFRRALDGAANTVRYRVPVQQSLDGNTVELATEQIAFADNAMRYRTTLSFLTGRIQGLMSALKGGE